MATFESTNQDTKTTTNTEPTLSVAELQQAFALVNDGIARASGAGGFYNQYQLIMREVDRFKYNILSPNAEHSGLTFFTRPKLNLTSTSLRQNRIMQALDTMNPNSLAFAVRCLLDTKFSKSYSYEAWRCPLFNPRSPWMTPLGNCLMSISGFPDLVLDTETTEGGFHSEDFTFAKGSDNLNKTYDLNANFRDIQGGLIMAIIHFYITYVSGLCKNEFVAYPEDIDAQRLNYTFSIYRFTLDPTRQFIAKWAKATGCMFKSNPIGACFNINEGETFVSSSAKFSVAITANKIEYNDYAILEDFNRLARRYHPEIKSLPKVSSKAENNFRGLPYIDYGRNGVELTFKLADNELKDEAIAWFDSKKNSKLNKSEKGTGSEEI